MGLMKCCRPSSFSWALDPRQRSSSTSHYPHAADVQTETGRGSGFPEVTETSGENGRGETARNLQEKNQDREQRGEGRWDRDREGVECMQRAVRPR